MHLTDLSDLVESAQSRISDLYWELGEIAVQSVQRGQPLGDFAARANLDRVRLKECYDVYVQFADCRGGHPHLLWFHFRAALHWRDATEMLTWAHDVMATTREMVAYRRAMNSDGVGNSPPIGQLF